MSSTIHALSASARRNSSHAVAAFPAFASTVWNSFTPRSNSLTKPAILSDSTSPRGYANRQSSATANGTTSMEISSMGSPLEFVQLAHVHRGEGLADAKDEYAEHHHRDHHVEEDADFNNERHAIGRQRNRGQHDAIFHRQERQHLGDGFAPVDHQEKAGEQERDGDGERVAAEPLERGDRAGDDVGENGQRTAN